MKGFRRIVLHLWLVWIGAGGTAVLLAQSSTRAKALVLEQQGKTLAAEQAWRGMVKSNPRNAEALAHVGLLEARQEHYPEAITFYRRAFALNASIPGLRMNLGLALFKAAKFQDAIQPFNSEMEKHPGDPRLTILLGMAHYGMGDYPGAIPYLRQGAINEPQSLPLRLTLAHSCLWTKQYQCVLDVYKEILDLNEESAEADMLAGEALDEKGDNAGATEQFRAAVRANPKEPNAHFGLAYLLWAQSRFEEAAKEFQAELDNDAKHGQARAYLGDCYVQLNEFDKAKPELEKAVVAEPSLALVHLDLGIVYADAGQKDEAQKELLRAAALDPKEVAPHWRLAKLYQTMGKKDESKAEFAKASTMNKQASQALHEKIAGASPHPTE